MDDMDQKNNNNSHRKSELRLSLRHTAAYSAAAVLLLGITFFGGYFFGKKQMAEQFIMKIDQDSFADQIYSSLCALYDGEEPVTKGLLVAENDAATPAKETVPLVDMVATTTTEESVSMAEQLGAKSGPSYYAELIGYGTRKAAELFVQKMNKKSISVELKERKSVTAQGKKREWYQVVTGRHKNRENLERITDRLAREEKINGIRIVTT